MFNQSRISVHFMTWSQFRIFFTVIGGCLVFISFATCISPPPHLSLSLSLSLSFSLSHSLSLSNNCARSQIALRRISKLVYFMGGITTAVQYAGLCRISRMERFAKIFYQYLYNVYYYFKYYLYFQKSYIFS